MLSMHCRTITLAVALASCAPTVEAAAPRPWPDVKQQGYVENAIELSEAGFQANLTLLDTEEAEPGSAEISALIQLERPLWGEAPFEQIQFKGPLGILPTMGGGWSGASLGLWGDGSKSKRVGSQVPIVLMSRGQADDVEILYVVAPEEKDAPVPIADLGLVRNLELEDDSPALRKRLIEAVVDPRSSKLLWSYALRRLYKLEDDPALRFGLVLHPQIQALAPGPQGMAVRFREGRLDYAVQLLTRDRSATREDAYRPREPEERKAAYWKLLEVFERSPSPYMADASLSILNEQALRKAEFTDDEWSQILARIRAAIDNPEHAIHKVDSESQPSVEETLKGLFGESYLRQTKR